LLRVLRHVALKLISYIQLVYNINYIFFFIIISFFIYFDFREHMSSILYSCKTVMPCVSASVDYILNVFCASPPFPPTHVLHVPVYTNTLNATTPWEFAIANKYKHNLYWKRFYFWFRIVTEQGQLCNYKITKSNTVNNDS